MFGILALLSLVAAAVCGIMVLVKLFQEKGALHGILGFICGLYTYIWGWMNASKNIMLLWTLFIILYVVFAMLSGGFSYSFGTPTATP
jgi:hypothetical protein